MSLSSPSSGPPAATRSTGPPRTASTPAPHRAGRRTRRSPVTRRTRLPQLPGAPGVAGALRPGPGRNQFEHKPGPPVRQYPARSERPRGCGGGRVGTEEWAWSSNSTGRRALRCRTPSEPVRSPCDRDRTMLESNTCSMPGVGPRRSPRTSLPRSTSSSTPSWTPSSRTGSRGRRSNATCARAGRTAPSATPARRGCSPWKSTPTPSTPTVCRMRS